ncbi:MAG: hypothetical protein ACK4E0_19025 [Chitinophagaceae bacterium]
MKSQLNSNFYGGFFLDVEMFYNYVQSGKLTHLHRCQDLFKNFREIIAENPADYLYKYFISHRWDDENDPDIRNWQIEALLQFSSELIANNQTPACFWYDYCSLPQKPRTTDEDELFHEGLKSLNYLCRTCTNVPLISKTDLDANISIKNMLKRGWILVELFISQHHENIYLTLFEGTSDLITFAKANRLNWQNTIPDLISELPFYDTDLIRKWFEINEIICTNGADLDLVAKLLHEHIYNYISKERKANLQALPFNKTEEISFKEIADYWINKYGSTPLFPDTYFEIKINEGKLSYFVTPIKKPSLPPIDTWTSVADFEFSQFQIDLNTLTTKFFPGIVFEYRLTNSGYLVKPKIKKIDW